MSADGFVTGLDQQAGGMLTAEEKVQLAAGEESQRHGGSGNQQQLHRPAGEADDEEHPE